MAQEIINIGPLPNDGQGDNLRTAFDKTNENFTQIWTAGPVGSNVRIAGNVISTQVVNQDLALSPNGTGNVRLNNNTIPGANNTWFLGSTTNRWRGLYLGSIGLDVAGNLTITGSATFGNDVYVGGNLTVEGDTIQIGNITTDTKTIQLSNTATTTGAADGSGVTVGRNDNIATFLYNAGNNVWTTNIGLQVGGPITGTSIAVSDATVYGNVDAINGNFTGNVTANYFIGDGSQLVNVPLANTIINGASQVTIPAANGAVFVDQAGQGVVRFAYVDNGGLDTIGEIAGQQNGLLLSSDPNNFESTLKLASDTGNLPGANLSTKTGNIELSTNTQFGSYTWKFDGAGQLTAPGNITANYFFGNGSQLTGITATTISNTAPAIGNGSIWWNSVDGRAYVKYNGQFIDLSPSLVPDPTTYVGNVVFDDQTIENVGNILPGTTNAYSLGSAAFQWKDLWVSNATIYMNSVPIGLTSANVLTVNGEPILSNNSTTSIVTTGGITANSFIGNGSQLTNLPDPNRIISGTTQVSVPATIPGFGNIVSVSVTGGQSTYQFNEYGQLTFGGINGNVIGKLGTDFGLAGIENVDIKIETSQTVGNASVTNFWTFGADGTLSAPGNITTNTGNITAAYFIGDGSQLTGLPPGYTDADVANLLAAFGSNSIVTTGNIDSGNITATYIYGDTTEANVFQGGSANISGNVIAGNFVGAGTNVDIVAGSYTWTFDDTGNVNIPGLAVVTGGIVGSGASPAPSLSGFSSLSAQSISLSGTGTAVNASSGNILTNKVTGTQFAFLNGIYTATLTGGGATSDYTLNLPANVGTNGQSLTSDGTGNLVWTTPASSYGNANVANFLANYGSNTIVTTGNITAGNLIGNISITGNVTGTQSNVDIIAGSYQWTFNNAGNLVLPGNTFSVNYANGTAVSLGGGSTYGDPNVVTLMSAFGSNTISTTGNVTSGNSKVVTAHRWSTGNATMSLSSGSIVLSPDTSLSATAGIQIGGSGYILAPDGSRNATLNYGGTSGTIGLYRLNIYGNQTTAIVNGGSNGVGNIGANTSNRFNTVFATAGDFSGNVTADIVSATNNGNGTNFKVGDDTWLGDVNVADTMSIRGQQNPANGYIVFGNVDTTSTLGRSGSGPLTYNGSFTVTGNITGNTAGFAIGYRDIPVLSLSANTTVSTSDAGKQYYSTSATPLTLTIANNASQAFQTGATINIINQGAGNVSVLRGTGVTMYLAGNSTSSDRTLTSYGVASITKVATDTWFISGVGLI